MWARPRCSLFDSYFPSTSKDHIHFATYMSSPKRNPTWLRYKPVTIQHLCGCVPERNRCPSNLTIALRQWQQHMSHSPARPVRRR